VESDLYATEEGMIMTRREEQQAGREALQEVTSQPGRERPHESAMARFVAGIAYEERQHEHEHERDNDEQETRNDHTSKPE
jgi:hypothetical protein